MVRADTDYPDHRPPTDKEKKNNQFKLNQTASLLTHLYTHRMESDYGRQLFSSGSDERGSSEPGSACGNGDRLTQ